MKKASRSAARKERPKAKELLDAILAADWCIEEVSISLWIYERLARVHQENRHVDYMHKLRSLVDAIHRARISARPLPARRRKAKRGN